MASGKIPFIKSNLCDKNCNHVCLPINVHLCHINFRKNFSISHCGNILTTKPHCQVDTAIIIKHLFLSIDGLVHSMYSLLLRKQSN